MQLDERNRTHIAPMHIAGESTAGSASSRRPIIDPSDGSRLGWVSSASAKQVDQAVGAAHASFSAWSRWSLDERVRLLNAFSDALAARSAELTELEVHGQGKLSGEVPTEINGLVRHCRVMAGEAARFPFLDHSDLMPTKSQVSWEPYGVVAAVLPWNAPLNAAVRRVGITIATGNTLVIKPSVLGSLTPTRVVEIAESVGVPPGVLNVVTGPGESVGHRLLSDPRIAKISFVGGSTAGVQVLRAAAANVQPAVAELGGKSPQIVFADAPYEDALNGVLRGFTRNAGQICSCGTRLLVESKIARRFVSDLVDRAATLVVGPAWSSTSQMGPQISAPHRTTIQAFVDEARAAGSAIATGGSEIEGSGFFYRPTIVTGVKSNDRLFQEEVFGPVLAVTEFKSEADAVSLANSTDYGIVAGIWTEDRDRGMRIAQQVDAGRCWVNGYWTSDPSLSSYPRRRSGVGSAETGSEALREFLRPKELTIN